MKKYKVQLTCIKYYSTDIEAEDEDEAVNIAEQSCLDRKLSVIDSEIYTDVEEIEEKEEE